MACKYYSQFTSDLTGAVYKVELWDTSYSSTQTEITLMYPGFTLEYQGMSNSSSNSEIFDPIKGSDVKVHLCITDNATGTALLSWVLNQVNQDQEDRFNVAIYKDGNIIWFGVILPDLSGRLDDSAPFEYTLSATDGLARLKDFTFDYAVSTDNLAKFTQIIYNILLKTPVFQNTSQSYLFSTCVDWWENSMPAKSASEDPLFLTQVHTKTFATKDDSGNWQGMSYYEVLEAICKHWGMRVIMWDGIYKFIQLGVYEDSGVSQYERFYLRSSGLYDTYLSFNPQVAINVSTGSKPRVKAGNQWNYYPAVKDVYLKFPFENKNLFVSPTVLLPTSQTITTPVVGGAGIYFMLTFAIQIDFGVLGPSVIGQTISVKFQLDSSFWLKKSPTGIAASWAASSNVYEQNIFFSPSNSTQVISIITPELPAGTFSSIYIEIDTTSSGIWNFSLLANSSKLSYLSSSIDENFIEYIAHNSAAPINSQDIQEPDALFGDGTFAGMYGALYVYTGSSVVLSGGAWRVNDTGSTYPFNILRIRDICAAQIRATPRYQGAIVGATSIKSFSEVSYSGRLYFLNRGTFSANDEIWDGEWIEVDYVHANVNDDTPTSGGGDNTLTKAMRYIGDVQGGVNYLAGLVDSGALTTGIGATITAQPYTQNLICTATITVNLPTAPSWIVNNRSCEITVINNGAGGDSVTLDGYGSETINGSTTKVLHQYDAAILISDGTNILIKG